MSLEILNIPAVLECVLQNLDTNYLSSTCRLVNSCWNYESCKILQARVTVSFSSTKRLERFNETFSSSIEHVSIRFQSFNFGRELFISAIEDSAYGYLKKLQNALAYFEETYGDNVLRLSYSMELIHRMESNTSVPYTVVMYKELFQILNRFRRLKILHILMLLADFEPLKDTFDLKEFALEFEQLQMPCLEQIVWHAFTMRQNKENVENHEGSNATSLCQEMVYFFVRKMLSSSPNLKSVVTEDTTSKRYLHDSVTSNLSVFPPTTRIFRTDNILPDSTLTELCLLENLEELELVFDAATTPESLNNNIFNRFKKSLHKLHIIFPEASRSALSILSFESAMQNLMQLSLTNFEGEVEWKLFPVLRTLMLSQYNSAILNSLSSYIQRTKRDMDSTCQKCNKEAFLSPNLPCLIKDLSLSREKRIAENADGSLEEFLSALPCCFLYNLSSLTLSHSGFVPLQKIFGGCGKLRKLSIESSRGLTDQALCGIRHSLLNLISPVGRISKLNPENLRELEHQQKEIIEMVDGSVVHGSELRDSHFIGDLKDLQILKIVGCELTDTSIIYGIAHCKRLRSVQIQSSLLTWRAETIMRIILEDLIHLSVP